MIFAHGVASILVMQISSEMENYARASKELVKIVNQFGLWKHGNIRKFSMSFVSPSSAHVISCLLQFRSLQSITN